MPHNDNLCAMCCEAWHGGKEAAAAIAAGANLEESASQFGRRKGAGLLI